MILEKNYSTNNKWCAFSLLGSEKVLSFCLDKWLEDIKVNQLPTILGGFGPLHAFVQLGKSLHVLTQSIIYRIKIMS